MAVNLAKIHTDSGALVERLSDRLPDSMLVECRSYHRAGEWAELVDVLCASLVERQIPVTPDERTALAELLALFPSPYEGYPYIDDARQTLGALTIGP